MSDLNALSRKYLLSRPEDRNTEKRDLILYNSQSVFPLLKETVRLCKEFNPLPKLRSVNSSYIMENVPRNLWVAYVLDPAITDTYQVIKTGGESCDDALVRALWDQDDLLKLIATLILMEIPSPSRKLVEQLLRTNEQLKIIDKSKPYYMKSAFPIALLFVLYQGGFSPAIEFINNLNMKERKSYEEQKVTLRNTVINYLFTETGR